MTINSATHDFVRRHADDDVRQLALRGSRDAAVDMTVALQQIQGRQTARRKLPSWAAADEIVYPPHLNMEQCSSEQTARYKAGLAAATGLSGPSEPSRPPTFLDLTGGFGVDFAFMSRGFARAIYVERDPDLCDIVRHNLSVLGVEATVVCADAAEVLHRTDHVALTFMDPARRDGHGARTYAISDCTPDVLSMKDELLQKSERVILKLSPMLDWRKTVADLGDDCVSEVHIVSVAGECKELLVVMQKSISSERQLRLVCVNDDSVYEPFWPKTRSVLAQNEKHFGPKRSLFWPKTSADGATLYLYEPNASVMKAGCWSALERDFGVEQIAENSHLFVSDRLNDRFPGRRFQVSAITSLNRRELRTALDGLDRANITVRNFPLSACDLRRRLKISEGGSTYLFATTLADGNHVLLVCRQP